MIVNKNDLLIRTSIWKANNKKCFYCNEYILFKDLEIDHIINEKISKKRLKELIQNLNLGKSFNLNSIENLVPTNHDCNNKKSSLEFSENTIRFYREIWIKKIPKVEKEINKLKNEADNDKILSTLAVKVENGDITLKEIISQIQYIGQEKHNTTEPIVVTLSINVLDLDENDEEKTSYIERCEILEEFLVLYLKENIKTIFIQTEASERNGETTSMRFAFWNFDLNHLDTDDILPWAITEVAFYSETYTDNWEDHFNKSIVNRYHEVIRDDSDPIFGLSICPECGNKELEKSCVTDYSRDKLYYLIKCKDCTWNDWTQ